MHFGKICNVHLCCNRETRVLRHAGAWDASLRVDVACRFETWGGDYDVDAATFDARFADYMRAYLLLHVFTDA